MSAVLEENRRHSRLVKKASRLDIQALLEIAAMKGLHGPSFGQGAGASSSTSDAASSSSSPGKGSSRHGEAGPPEVEADEGAAAAVSAAEVAGEHGQDAEHQEA